MTMKSKLVFINFLIIMGMFLSGAAPAQSDITVGSASGAPGATVMIPVTVENNSEAVGAQLDIQFTSAALTPGAPNGGNSLSPHTMNSSGPSSGTLRVLLTPPSSFPLPSLHNGTVVKIPFTIKADAAPGIYPLSLSNVVFSDGSAHSAASGLLTSGSIKVSLYRIFGRVKTSTGAPMARVTVTLSGDAGKATKTNATGKYVFRGLTNGTYTVTPSMRRKQFKPASRVVTINGGSMKRRSFRETLRR